MNPTNDHATPYPLFAAIDRQGPILTREQERCLARRVRDGDPRARAQLIEANLRLAVKLAAQRAPSAPMMELHDLIQEATTGLMLAIDRFDPERGFKLSTYATWWINQALTRAVAKDGTVHMPIELRSQLRREEARLAERLGREPTDRELASQLDLDSERVRQARAAMTPLSLDAPLTDQSDSACFGDILPDHYASDPAEIVTEHADLRTDIERITRNLPRRERTVIDRRYGLNGETPSTSTQIAADMGADPATVRRVERRAIDALRSATDQQPVPSPNVPHHGDCSSAGRGAHLGRAHGSAAATSDCRAGAHIERLTPSLP